MRFRLIVLPLVRFQKRPLRLAHRVVQVVLRNVPVDVDRFVCPRSLVLGHVKELFVVSLFGLSLGLLVSRDLGHVVVLLLQQQSTFHAQSKEREEILPS